MEIREGSPSDRNAVQGLWTDAGLPPATEDQWKVLVAGGTGGASLLVAEDAGAVVGAAVIAYDGWRAFIYHVAVSSSARRGGVARALMEKGERLLEAQGASLIFALAKESMTDGIALLAATGYEPEGDIAFVKALGGPRNWPRVVPER